jgi:hypothetical protein
MIKKREGEGEGEGERRFLTSLFRKSPPVFMPMFLNKSYKPQVLSRTPWSSLHLTLITTWCSPFSHDLSLSLSPPLKFDSYMKKNRWIGDSLPSPLLSLYSGIILYPGDMNM